VEFKEFLLEMTQSFGQMPELPMPDDSQAEYVGDIEDCNIFKCPYQDTNIYFLKHDGTSICFAQTKPKILFNKEYLEIIVIQTDLKYQGKGYAKKLLFFLRSIEGKLLVFGDRQSKLGQQLIKSIANTGYFPMFWLNTKTGERHPYDANKDNFRLKPFRDLPDKTDWVVICEAVKEVSMPRFIPENYSEGWHFRYIRWFD
jgi:hypothetical protein